jgi:hypothetical protein
VFTSNSAGVGGAICNLGNCHINSTAFLSNSAVDCGVGGAISHGILQAWQPSDISRNSRFLLSIKSSNITSNSAGWSQGGAVSVSSGCHATIRDSDFTDNAGSGGAVFVGQAGVAVIMKCAFSGNSGSTGPGEQGASVAQVETGGKALFYLTVAFAFNMGDLFVVAGGGTLLLDGGVFPCHRVNHFSSFGQVDFGSTLLLRNMPEYNPRELQPASTQGSCTGGSTTNVAGLCPAYTTQTYWWKVTNETTNITSLKNDSDPCFHS